MTPAVIKRDEHQYSFDSGHPPAAKVASGSTVVVETYDCFTNKINSPGQVFNTEEGILDLVGAYNPISRPIYVLGAQPGDTLAVHIDSIALGTFAPYAVTTMTQDFAGICGSHVPVPGLEPNTRICALEGERVLFPTSRGQLALLARPMVGTIGTAPARGCWMSLHSDPGHGGNMDCPSVTTGSTILLPVNVPGGLLSLGDVHAAMGDAEITGTALETNADVTITIDLIPQTRSWDARLPQLETVDTIGAIGCLLNGGVQKNIELAFRALHNRLQQQYGLHSTEAMQLLGAAARVEVNQCVGDSFGAVHVSLPRLVLRNLTNLPWRQ